MSSTTIRYSGVPENSHSGDLTGRTATRSGVQTATDPDALRESADGFYDWAGRRLFLSDGSPDPLTPGAYRYQASPDYCDLEAPESDPSSLRYEPPHLRHQPGDTWLIDRDRPHAPDDPGPFGSPGWRPDPRTGRHRRDELPDPIPPWEREPEPRPEAQGGDSVPPWRPKRHILSGPSDPEEPQPDRVWSPDSRPRPRLPIEPDRPSPQPRDRSRFWSEADRTDTARTPAPQPPWAAAPAVASTPPAPLDPPHRFDKLREDAWDRFLMKSEHLAAANRANLSALEREYGWQIALWVRFFRWLAALVRSFGSSPEDPAQGAGGQGAPAESATDSATTHTSQRIPAQRREEWRAGRSGIAPDRRTYLAARTARFAQAMRGAQRAQAAPAATGGAAWA